MALLTQDPEYLSPEQERIEYLNGRLSDLLQDLAAAEEHLRVAREALRAIVAYEADLPLISVQPDAYVANVAKIALAKLEL